MVLMDTQSTFECPEIVYLKKYARKYYTKCLGSILTMVIIDN